MSHPSARPSPVRLPDAPALVAGVRAATWLSADGEVETLALDAAAVRALAGPPPLVCHGPATARRLGIDHLPALDLLELFAFVRPARFCLPTPGGLAEVLGQPLPAGPEAEAQCLFAVAALLLDELADPGRDTGADARGAAWSMARGGWTWGPSVLAVLGVDGNGSRAAGALDGLKAWRHLGEWEERAPEPPSASWTVEPVEARARLVQLLGTGAEERPQQAEYAGAVAAAFRPREHQDEPHVVLAEAGTGVGKTLGYLAPASVWAEKNQAPVWISTFTRNLQRQLDAELDRLYPDAEEKARNVVVRKGRENYLCLLNLEEAVQRVPVRGAGDAVALGLMARWAVASRDGDMVGGDFPAWLTGIVGRSLTVGLTDRRGECIYSACRHFRKCYIERSIRRARRARIVIANHALVLIQAALGGGDDEALRPTRYVIDEGHHLFDAADSAFSAHLSGAETADLRRWLLGAETGARSRSRGLRTRLDDLIAGDEAATKALAGVLRAAQSLPGPGWRQRLTEGNPIGPAEAFLALVRQQVFARDPGGRSPYSLETLPRPPVDGLLQAARTLEEALLRLSRPLTDLAQALGALLDSQAGDLETAMRLRIEAMRRTLERWRLAQIIAWRSMLQGLEQEPGDDPGETPGTVEAPTFIDWFSVERLDGRELDVGYHRHWVDPTRPFAEVVATPAHGLLVTSATLRDTPDSAHDGWTAAEERTGVRHLEGAPVLTAVPSPFDYAGDTKVLVVTDVARDRADQVAAAYRELFLAAGGGALGLFTAIARLRAVYDRIAGPLDESGLRVLAQHIDALDTGTLIDIFRAEENACLLGTDAVRDGIDVPGRSLRLIVFDRMPWPRPDILHRARRAAFGGRTFDEMLTRLKLKQAYGRLIRRAGDRGVFVMLDRAMPSRLAGAFPDGVQMQRLGLADAVAEVRAFLAGPQ